MKTSKKQKKPLDTRPVKEGIIALTGKGVGYVRPVDETEEIEIARESLNTALHGDSVKVFILPEKRGGRIAGEITEIISRNKMEFIGRIERKGNLVFLIADDRKMYTDIFIPNEKSLDAENGQKAFVKINDWRDPKKNPVGEVVKILGNPGDHETEIQAIIVDKGFDTEFPPKVEEEAKQIPHDFPAEEIAKRKDLRGITTFTIDPEDAKDFDDALSYQTLPNGDIEIGVHIADVSHYVRPGSALDREAKKRGTSVYLVDRVIPMLPEILSNDLCSLKPNEDRFAFSAIFTFDVSSTREGMKPKIKGQWFGKTIIHSDKRFSYESAQEILDAKNGTYLAELESANKIAKNLSKERHDAGAISFEQDEVKIILDENNKPIKVVRKQRKDTHKLVEEFMLLANKRVAEFIGKIGQKEEKLFVYRIHNEPNKERLLKLATFLKGLGYELKLNEEGGVSPKDLNELLAETEGGPLQNIVTSTALRAMAKAVYSTKNVGHFGLGFEHYTHFTSPIRRYPDILSHRLLETHLLKGDVPEEAWHEYEAMLVYASERESIATDAERASIKFKQVEYMQEKVGQVFTGTITGVTEWGLYVEEKESKAEGMIRIRDLGDDYYTFDEQNYRLVGKHKKKRYTLGDEIQVKLMRADALSRQLDFVLE